MPLNDHQIRRARDVEIAVREEKAALVVLADGDETILFGNIECLAQRSLGGSRSAF
jgi:hypothetical protein